MKRSKLIIILVCISIIWSCADDYNKNDINLVCPKIENIDTLIDKYSDKSVSENNEMYVFSDTFFVKNNAAVFLVPDSLEIEKMILEIEEDDFYTAVDDYNYYSYLAQEELKNEKISIINTDKHFICFLINNLELHCLEKTTDLFFSMFFFKSNAYPVEYDLIDFEINYFDNIN